MRYPEFLKDNGSIGFVAPSFGCNIEPYKSALKYNQIYDPIRISYFISSNYHGNKPLLIITPVLNQCLAALLLLEEQTYCYFISVPKVAWSRFSIEKEVALR